MKEYKIKFKHLVEQTFTAIIEAEDENHARQLFDEDPFSNLEDEEPANEQGLDIEIISVNPTTKQ